jgi:hypothetical protein
VLGKEHLVEWFAGCVFSVYVYFVQRCLCMCREFVVGSLPVVDICITKTSRWFSLSVNVRVDEIMHGPSTRSTILFIESFRTKINADVCLV